MAGRFALLTMGLRYRIDLIFWCSTRNALFKGLVGKGQPGAAGIARAMLNVVGGFQQRRDHASAAGTRSSDDLGHPRL